MPKRTDQFDHGNLFRQFLPQNGVPRAWGNFVTWMNRAGRPVGRDVRHFKPLDTRTPAFEYAF
ncbi:MAG: hypothetical protein WD490_02900 [Opitutales bacterium]